MNRRSCIVVVALTVGCSGTGAGAPEPEPQPEPEPEMTRNPPMPVEIHEVGLDGPVAAGTALNARQGSRTIYKQGAACVIYVDDGQMRPPGSFPPATVVDCPPTMQDPAWDQCANGSLQTTADPAVCTCYANGGNPPPPPTSGPCPAHVRLAEPPK